MAVFEWRILARWWVFACYFFSSLRALLHPRHCEFLSSRHCESFPSRHCEEWNDEAISSLHVLVGVRCSGGIASLTAFARNDGVGLQARNDGKEEVACDDDTLRKSVTSCSSFNKNSLLTRCKVFIPEGLGWLKKKIIKKIFAYLKKILLLH